MTPATITSPAPGIRYGKQAQTFIPAQPAGEAEGVVPSVPAAYAPYMTPANVQYVANARARFNPIAGIKASGGRMVDALAFFALSSVIPGLGHLVMWPIALADGAVAVNEFRKASGLPPLIREKAAAVFLDKAKTALDKAKVDATKWEKPFKGLYKFGLAATVAGVLVHPLLFIGPLLFGVPLIARDLGITVSIIRQLIQQGVKQTPITQAIS